MRSIRWIAVGVLAVAGVTFAEPSTQPAKKAIRVASPWSKVTDLSEDQKEKLVAIRSDIAGKIKALREEEQVRCGEVLTPEQKAALEATLAREAAERKAKAAERKSGNADGGKGI